MRLHIFCLLGAFSVVIFVFAANTSANAASFNVGLEIGKKTKTDALRPKYTCGAAKTKISMAGYHDIQTLECSGNVYLFTAQMNSSSYNIGFDAMSGKFQIN